MQAQNTNPKPTRQDLLAAWAAYEAARTAADAAKVYYRLNRRERGEDVAKLPIDKRRNK